MTSNPIARLPGEDGTHLTYCRLCEALCGLAVEVENGRIVEVRPDRDHPVSKGHVCPKGTRMREIVHDADRVLTPLRRTGGPGDFERVSWDEALDDIAARLGRIHAERGGESIALYMGNPASFSLLHYGRGMGFLRALDSNQMYGPAHVDTIARNYASRLVFGTLKFPMPDIEHCDFLLMIGANPLVSKMSLVSAPRALQKLDAIAERGRVVVLDPRRTETAARYEHIAVQPDSDVWLLAGMLRTIFEEQRFDESALNAKVRGWEALREAVSRIDWGEAERRSGVDANRIRALARDFADARTAAAYGRLGTNRGRFATLTSVLIDALNLVTGRFAAKGGWGFGFYPLEPEGAPAGLPTSPPTRIGDIPSVAAFKATGVLAAEITTPGDGQIRALLVESGNPVRAYPQGREIEAALEDLDLMVAMDFYVTETTKHAHYILPTPTFLERDDFPDLWMGTMLEPMLQFTEAVLPPQGESRSEYELYDEILRRMELPDPWSALQGRRDVEPRLTKLQMLDTLVRVGPLGDGFGARPDGLDLEKIRAEPRGLFMPDALDLTRSWSKVGHEDGKAHLWNDVIAGEFERLADEPAPEPGGLKLFGRRMLKSLNSWMHNNERLLGSDRPTLLMHPEDASERKLENGQRVRVRSRAGEVVVELRVSDEVVRGGVSYPHGWGHAGGWQNANAAGGADINELASSDPADWEAISGACHLDGIPVEVCGIDG